MRNGLWMFALGLAGVVVVAGNKVGAEQRDGTAQLASRGPTAVTASSGADLAGTAVWDMLVGFLDRSPERYVAAMSVDFHFDSDDPDFRAAFPGGMSRSDEASFATHLFRGGARDCHNRPLPTATHVALSAGPMLVSTDATGAIEVVLDHLEAWIVLTNGDTMRIADTRNRIRMSLTPDGYRVTQWQERHPTQADRDSLARRLAEAAGPPRPTPPKEFGSGPERRSERGALSTSAGVQTPARLELAGEPDAGHAALVFELAMPRPGGALEIYDVMGRRVLMRDLSDLGVGRHRIAIDVASLGPGVYFARVRQEQGIATTRVVWAR
jgi:hypothetical protein